MYIVIFNMYFTCVLIISLPQKIIYGFDSLTIYQERKIYRKGEKASMAIMTNNQYELWLKSTENMRLLSDASVLSITYEGLTNFQYFMDFNHNSIKSLLIACIKEIDSIVSDVPNWIFSTKSCPGDKHQHNFNPPNCCNYKCCEILHSDRTNSDFENMHYVNLLGEFTTDYNAYVMMKGKKSP